MVGHPYHPHTQRQRQDDRHRFGPSLASRKETGPSFKRQKSSLRKLSRRHSSLSAPSEAYAGLFVFFPSMSSFCGAEGWSLLVLVLTLKLRVPVLKHFLESCTGVSQRSNVWSKRFTADTQDCTQTG